MCIMCERELWGEHRALEREFFKPCKTCKKFPGLRLRRNLLSLFRYWRHDRRVPRVRGQAMD